MKTEVRALEQAVCALVARLDILLTAEFGLRLLDANNGLRIHTPDHLSEVRDDAFVTIRPVGWPNGSSIQARFAWSGGSWQLYEGAQIWADHLPIPVYGLRFVPTNTGLGIRLDSPTSGYQHQFIAQAYGQLVESLQQDRAAHEMTMTE